MKYSDSVLYCDNHVLIAKKPALLPTQPNRGSLDSLETRVKAWVKEAYHKKGNVFLHAVHRLDKPVSGLVLFARTSKALSRLNEQMRAKTIERIYQADLEGILEEDEGCLEHFLCHGSHRALLVSPSDPRAKRASLFYRVEKRWKNRTRVQIQLETGRYHQIRAQFSAIGHPVVGDTRYGASDQGGAVCLACVSLSFEHPSTKKRLTWSCAAEFAQH